MVLTWLQLSESDTQDRKSCAPVTVSSVATNVATQSPVNSMTQVSQPLPTTPQPAQPSPSPQLGMETIDSKGASPAPENKESTEFVPFFLAMIDLLFEPILIRILSLYFDFSASVILSDEIFWTKICRYHLFKLFKL